MNNKFVDKQGVNNKGFLSNEYIRGLVDGEGCFSFYPGSKKSNGRKYRLPAFILAMHERDLELVTAVRDALSLRNKIYVRKPSTKDGYKRGNIVFFVVREFDQLKDIIIPFFYKRLKGYKGKQFIAWLERIGSDPDVSDRYKSLWRLYKWGSYDTNKKFINKFKE